MYYSYVYNLLNKISKDAHKNTKKEHKKKEKLKERSQKNIHIARNRTNRAGHIVETDACFGNFVNVDGEDWALHGFIDQATGKVLALHFEKEETTLGYFNAFEKVLKNHGVFEVLRTDKRAVFWSKKKDSSPEESKIQFMFVANTLGIDVQSSSQAQSKARIERLWRTARSNIVYFLRKRKVKTLEHANRIIDEFTNYLNDKVISIQNNYTLDGFTKFDGDTNILLGFKKELTVSKDLTIKHENKKCSICEYTTPLNIPRQKILLIFGRDGKLYASYDDWFYYVIEMNSEILFKSQAILEKGRILNMVPKKPKNNAAWDQSNFIFFKKNWKSWQKKTHFLDNNEK